MQRRIMLRRIRLWMELPGSTPEEDRMRKSRYLPIRRILRILESILRIIAAVAALFERWL